jgi:hypothetical protein
MAEQAELIRLPYGGRPGRRVIAIRNAILANEPWERPRFNCVISPYIEPLQGIYGESLIEPILGVQNEINYHLKELRVQARKHGTTIYELPKGSEISSTDRMDPRRNVTIKTNMPGAGAKIYFPQLANPQVFQVLSMHWAKGFELTGMSELAAHAMKPPGLDSGAALREWHDLTSERFSVVHREYEMTRAECGQLYLDAAEDIDRRGGWSVTLRGEDDALLEPVPFSEIKLDEGKYQVTVWPGSSLPQSPAGRAATIANLVNSNVPLPQEIILQLLRWNDLDKHLKLETAPRRDLVRTFEHMLTTGEYQHPHPMQDLRLGVKLARELWATYKHQDSVKPERLSMLDRWRMNAEGMIAAQEAQAAPPAAPAPNNAAAAAAPPVPGNGTPLQGV